MPNCRIFGYATRSGRAVPFGQNPFCTRRPFIKTRGVMGARVPYMTALSKKRKSSRVIAFRLWRFTVCRFTWRLPKSGRWAVKTPRMAHLTCRWTLNETFIFYTMVRFVRSFFLKCIDSYENSNWNKMLNLLLNFQWGLVDVIRWWWMLVYCRSRNKHVILRALIS